LFDYWRRFLHVWLQSLKKYKYDLKKIKKVSKNAEFRADFKSVESFKKMYQKKLLAKT